jgi:hypothetical protein
MVVETTTVSVVTKVVCSEAGQFVTVEGQAVIVAVRVLRTVDVVFLPSVSVAWEGSVVVARVVDRKEVNVVSAFIEEVVIAVVVVVVVIVEIVNQTRARRANRSHRYTRRRACSSNGKGSRNNGGRKAMSCRADSGRRRAYRGDTA